MKTHINKTQETKSKSIKKQGNDAAASHFLDNRPEAAAQKKLQEIAKNNSSSGNKPVPIQMSGGSSQANKELASAMGKAATRVDKLPAAKPHTKKGTGSGGGTDHQARNAMVIKKAKQDTMKAHNDPTMFSPSRMRSDDRAKEKDADAAEKRQEKAAASNTSMDDYEKAMIQATTTYKGNQEGFDNYLKARKFLFPDNQLDDLYQALSE
jgi:hypothetical protein